MKTYLHKSKKYRCISFILLFMIGVINIYAQQNKTITGKVTDDTGEAIIGASIAVENTTIGVLTDVDGNYSISVPANAEKLKFSFMGYITQHIAIKGENVINVILREGTQALDEVVVVGYGVQKKVNLTGSVASVSAKELESRPLTNASSGLGGLIPGVRIVQTSGKPGSDGATIRVRGTNTLNDSSPLVIVDGIEGDINAVNPSDIESVNVLKDAASSAIYGARAANGVILITTKKGSKDRTAISFSSTFSKAQASGIRDHISDFVTYMNTVNTANVNAGATPSFGEVDFKNWEYANAHPNELNEYGYPMRVAYPNTDWYDVILKEQWVQNYNLSARGGSDKMNYSLSLGYLNNPGIMNNSGIEQINGRVNVEAKITKFLTVGTQTWFMKRKSERGDTADAFSKTRSSSPAVYPKYGEYYGSTAASGDNQQANNPLFSVDQASGFYNNNRLITTWYAKFDIIKGLNFETKFNYTYSNYEMSSYSRQFERYNFATNQLTSAAADLSTKDVQYGYQRNRTLTVENLINYNTTIAQDHTISALLGHNEFYYHTYNFYGTGRGLIDISLPNLSSTSEPKSVTGTESDNSMRSFFGRINYDYKSKYLFEANVRYDGSSKFADGNRWGVFPSFSAGWRLEQEDFMPDWFKNTFQNFKIRGSWGRLGNSSVAAYRYLNTYQQHSEGQYSFGGTAAPGLIIKNIGNPSLKWESTDAWGAALETNFLDQRAAVSVEYYDKYTDGILFAPTINGILGYKNAPVMNLAEVSNRGVEVTLGWNDRIKDFNYSIGVNFSYNKNNVEKYKGTLVQGMVDGVWTTNYSSVANGTDNVTLEGHIHNEHRVLKVYRGSGNYYNSDGSVNINGGPKDGMIRTEADLEWVKSMVAAGYKFNAVTAANIGKKNGLYYGDMIYADVNGDGTYGNTSTDRIFTGTSSVPKWNLGMNLSASYKGFDFSMIWMGLFKAQTWSSESATNNHIILAGGKIPTDIANNSYFYDPENPNDPRTNINGKYPRLRTGSDSFNTVRSDFWLSSTSFLRLKNIQLGYTLPKSVTRPLNITNLRLFVSGENLLTITPFEGMDPEAQVWASYPTLKQYAFGFNLTF